MIRRKEKENFTQNTKKNTKKNSKSKIGVVKKPCATSSKGAGFEIVKRKGVKTENKIKEQKYIQLKPKEEKLIEVNVNPGADNELISHGSINEKLDLLIAKNNYFLEQLENEKNENYILRSKLQLAERKCDETARIKIILKQLEEDYKLLSAKYETSENLRNAQEISLKNLHTALGKFPEEPEKLLEKN